MTRDVHDLHDRGLAFDLSTLAARAAAPVRLERRGALKLLAGAAGGLLVVGCGGSEGSSGTTTSQGGSSSTLAGGASSSTTTTTTSGSGGEAIPEETAGPFPGDGSNGPDVLAESGVVRGDIRSSFGPYSGSAEGVPLQVDLTIVAARSGEPVEGAAVYLWHCDATGLYSLYSQGATEQNWLRGVQAADASGVLRFTTIFPGAYRGRYPHMHFEVFPSLDDATSARGRLVTSQLALPADACEAAYAADGYSASASNFPSTPIDRDGIFSDGYASQMAVVEGDTSGMTATLTVAV